MSSSTPLLCSNCSRELINDRSSTGLNQAHLRHELRNLKCGGEIERIFSFEEFFESISEIFQSISEKGSEMENIEVILTFPTTSSSDPDKTIADPEEIDENTSSSLTLETVKKPSLKAYPERKKTLRAKVNGGRGYYTPVKLSPQLAALVGKDCMSRDEVVKTVWNYIKQRNLRDPRNEQFVICDDDLYKVMGVKYFRPFGMMKFLKNHFL